MQSQAQTVAAYLASLPAERRATLESVRALIRANLAPGFAEGMQYGMLGYYVPHALYPAGYHCDPKQPLPFVCLAAQKNYFSLYLFCLYVGGELQSRFVADWKKTGKRLNMGKSCVRFQKLDDLATDVVAKLLRKITVPSHIQAYEAALATHRSSKQPQPKAKSSAKLRTAKPAARSLRPAQRSAATQPSAAQRGRQAKSAKPRPK